MATTSKFNDPLLIKMIENSVKLDQAIRELQNIKEKQELNHVVALALGEHKTIERVDTLWDTMRQLNGSLMVIRIFLIGLAAIVPVLVFTHQAWHWPA